MARPVAPSGQPGVDSDLASPGGEWRAATGPHGVSHASAPRTSKGRHPRTGMQVGSAVAASAVVVSAEHRVRATDTFGPQASPCPLVAETPNQVNTRRLRHLVASPVMLLAGQPAGGRGHNESH